MHLARPALPLIVLARLLVVDGAGWQRWSWSLSVILVSIPHQTVWRLAGLPAGAVEGLAIAGMPTWGAVLLFFIALSVARAKQAAAVAGQSVRLSVSPAAAQDFTAGLQASAEPFRRMTNG